MPGQFPILTNGNPTADLMMELANFLAPQLGLVIGQTLFIGELPEPGLNSVPAQDVTALYLVELPGPEPDDYLDTEHHLADFWASGSDSGATKALLRTVYGILNRKGNYALVNWYIYFSKANSTIRDEGRGKEGNKLFSLGMTFTCRNLNNVS